MFGGPGGLRVTGSTTSLNPAPVATVSFNGPGVNAVIDSFKSALLMTETDIAFSSYSQDLAADDIAAVMGGLNIDRAHVVGCSMGAFAALHFGLRYAQMARSLVVVGCGYGAKKDGRDGFNAEVEGFAASFLEKGMVAVSAPARSDLLYSDWGA